MYIGIVAGDLSLRGNTSRALARVLLADGLLVSVGGFLGKARARNLPRTTFQRKKPRPPGGWRTGAEEIQALGLEPRYVTTSAGSLRELSQHLTVHLLQFLAGGFELNHRRLHEVV